MGVLRTIVATTVIVFALTTVAMAGVQHLTKSEQTAAQTAQPTYTITLTDGQLANVLLAGQKQTATHTTKHVQRHEQQHVQRHTQKHAENAPHIYATTRTATYGTSQQSSGGGDYRCDYYGHPGDSGHGSGSCDSRADHGGCD